MFYQDEFDYALRFGDVIKGFALAASNFNNPEGYKEYDININLPDYCVILSPCCSIGDKKITLSPLIGIRASFLKNPYFGEDLTRINRKMKPEQAVPEGVWEKLPPQEKERRLQTGITYAFIEYFVYEHHDLLPKYSVDSKEGKIETNYYMIDFRNTYKISCDKIITAKDSPLSLKLLQLSVHIRAELRDKISNYYGRIPEEDIIYEE